MAGTLPGEEGEQSPSPEDIDFGDGPEGAVLDPGEEGPVDADEELRDEDLPDLDADEEGELDDAGLLGSASWVRGESDAVCPYGRPMPLSVPSPNAGILVPVPGVAAD